MTSIRRWDGSKWIDHLPKRWTGSKWDDAEVKRWSGSKWEIISEKEYVTTWNATWSASYNGASNASITSRIAKFGETVSHYALWHKNTWAEIVNWNGLTSPHYIYAGTRYIVDKVKFPNRRNSSGWMYQGRAQVATKFDSDRGRQRSMIGFNHSDIRTKLNGAKIEKVELYLRSKHFHNTSGGDAVIGYHNSTDASNFSETVNSAKVEHYSRRDQAKWVTLPDNFGELLRDNKAKGLTLYANTDSLKRYGYFYGFNSGDAPRLRITYKK